MAHNGSVETRRFLIIFGAAFGSVFALVGGILGYVFFLKPEFLDCPGTVAALGRVREDERVVELLGAPFDRVKARGGVTDGAINSKVDVVLDLRGPRGEAELEVVGFQIAKGPWEFSTLTLRHAENVVDLTARAE